MPEPLTRDSGYLFLTPQEELTYGSTPDPKYANKPYVPYVVQEGMSPHVANKAREHFRAFMSYRSILEDKDGKEVPRKENESNQTEFALSPLNTETGETLEDPKPLDPKLRIKMRLREELLFRE